MTDKERREEERKYNCGSLAKFEKQCKNCGAVFYPWRALEVTNEKTGPEGGYYCPKCQTFEKKSWFNKV